MTKIIKIEIMIIRNTFQVENVNIKMKNDNVKFKISQKVILNSVKNPIFCHSRAGGNP